MDETPGVISAGAPQQESATATVAAPFECPTCHRGFDSAIALQTHTIRAHKKFWSTNRGGRRPDVIARARRKIGRPRKGRVPCPICQQTYANPDSLRAHILRTHKQSTSGLIPGKRNAGRPANALPGKPGPKPGRLKRCPVCQRTFSTRAIMGRHLRYVHQKSVRDFPELEPRGGLAAMSAAAAEVHTCPVCSKTYKARPYLAIHTRKVHGKSINQLSASSPNSTELLRVDASTNFEHKGGAREKHEGRPVMFCPVCGTNIHNVQTAVNFGG